MKSFFTLCTIIILSLQGYAQTDTTISPNADTTITPQSDTIRIGGMVIIRKSGGNDSTRHQDRDFKIQSRKRNNNSNINTNWWIVDLGFSNYVDNTNYATANSSGYLAGGGHAFVEDDFKLRTGKSVNVNIWVFMQKLNLIKHVVNLKYGLGVELNNYRYKKDNPISYSETSPPQIMWEENMEFSKNKLAADYVTVPLMINFNTTPKSGNRGFSLSAGISGGYLYSSRNKQISDENGKQKEKGDIGINRWKLAYIGELGLGPVRLYGSYAITDLHETGLSQRPYNVGIRFSNW
ncbi:MAG: outer membrane beta-barrel protein [Chitinophagaceae bacterium]|jgi:hypothetical protein|nr:outer membrane beta-barrel protein [Chitinophagaceae bacterium]